MGAPLERGGKKLARARSLHIALPISSTTPNDVRSKTRRLSKWPNRRSVAVVAVVLCGFSAWTYRYDHNIRDGIRVSLFHWASGRKSKKLLLLGDSRINSLNCRQVLADYNVLNLGVPGLKTHELLQNIAERRLLRKRFSAIVVWIGVNDFLHLQRDSKSVSRDLKTIAMLIMSKADRVAIIDQIPIAQGRETEVARAINLELMRVNDVLKSDLAGSEVRHISPFERVPGQDIAENYSDHVHLSTKGNARLCGAMAAWLKSL
ncbi:MAG: SGNH/GDSL hydrolase family protein [Hyphomicrobium sp.]